MFGLTGATKYKYIPNYSDMRGGYDKLSGVVRSLGENPENGTAYVFMSKNQKLVKIIRYDKGRCLYYSQKFKGGFSFVRLRFNVDKPVYVLEWKYLVSLMGTPVIKDSSFGSKNSVLYAVCASWLSNAILRLSAMTCLSTVSSSHSSISATMQTTSSIASQMQSMTVISLNPRYVSLNRPPIVS